MPGLIEAVALEGWERPISRAHLVRVVLVRTSEGLGFRPTGSQSSGVLRSMVAADGLLLLGPDQTIAAGQTGRVQVLDLGFLDGERPEYGW